MSPPSRAVAAAFLEKVERGRKVDELVLHPGFLALESRDRRLVSYLVYGVLRHRGSLDYRLERLSRRPLTDLEPVVPHILRVGALQLLETRVPARAAVFEAVESCRRLGSPGAAGLVNAVLRRLQREPVPLPEGDSDEALAVRCSHPLWFVSRLVGRCGRARAARILDLNNTPPRPCFWVNPFRSTVEEMIGRLTAAGFECEEGAGLGSAVRVAPSLAEHPLYSRGFGFFLDEESLRVACRLPLEDAAWVGDLCAAPGGKTFVLSARLGSGARLISTDVSYRRIRELRRRARLYRIPVNTVVCDVAGGVPLGRRLDSVLVDAPCSGTGTFRSRPDLRWRPPPDLAAQQDRQVAVLQEAARAVKPGGWILYSTCSMEPEENEQVVEAFLRRSGGRLEARHRTAELDRAGDCFYHALIRQSREPCGSLKVHTRTAGRG